MNFIKSTTKFSKCFLLEKLIYFNKNLLEKHFPSLCKHFSDVSRDFFSIFPTKFQQKLSDVRSKLWQPSKKLRHSDLTFSRLLKAPFVFHTVAFFRTKQSKKVHFRFYFILISFSIQFIFLGQSLATGKYVSIRFWFSFSKVQSAISKIVYVHLKSIVIKIFYTNSDAINLKCSEVGNFKTKNYSSKVQLRIIQHNVVSCCNINL